MKKTILIFLAFTSLNAICQNRFGVIAGATMSTLNEGFMKQVSVEVSIAPQFGVFYEREITEKFYIRPRLVLTSEGDRVPTTQYSSEVTHESLDYQLTYINLPIDLKFGNKVYLIAGPQIGFLINQKGTNYYQGPAKSSVDLGLNLGMGVKIHKVFIELGLYQGLTPVLEAYYLAENRKFTNAYARLSIGWYIFK